MIVRLLAAALAITAAQAALFDFPTRNHALLGAHPEDFYMYVDRDFEGQKSCPWEGGQFGYVRGPLRTAAGVTYRHLHEGIDIQPLRRDPAGNPLDDVLAAAPGRIVHVSKEAGASNYGRYIVIEHRIDGCPIYTLYAHLATTEVIPGQVVKQGDVLGRMGFSGAGINRQRAHVHFEIGILLSENFESWYRAHMGGTPNRHGIYNGMNLSGTDPAAVLIAAAKAPDFQLTRFLAAQEPVFQITIPATPDITLLRDYPWLIPNGEVASPPAWKISFTGTGFPVRAVASPTAVATPEATWVTPPAGTSVLHATRGLVSGTSEHPRLTESGKRFAALLLAAPPAADSAPDNP